MNFCETLIIIPTYEEEETIGILLQKLNEFKMINPDLNFEVLVVDDNSKDKTIDVISKLGFPWVNFVIREKKDGLGNAYKHGFKWARDRNFRFVIEMDADGSHRVEDLKKLLGADKKFDLVLGSRWIEGGATVNWPIRRQLLSKFGNLYARKLLRLKVKDATGGFRRITLDTLFNIDLDLISPQGYGFQIAVVYLFEKNHFNITEMPITFVERESGYSKMTKSIALEAFKYITKTRLFGIK